VSSLRIYQLNLSREGQLKECRAWGNIWACIINVAAECSGECTVIHHHHCCVMSQLTTATKVPDLFSTERKRQHVSKEKHRKKLVTTNICRSTAMSNGINFCLNVIVIIRPHRVHNMQTTVIDDPVAWAVCLSRGRLCRNAWTDRERRFWSEDLGPWNAALDGGQSPAARRGGLDTAFAKLLWPLVGLIESCGTREGC